MISRGGTMPLHAPHGGYGPGVEAITMRREWELRGGVTGESERNEGTKTERRSSTGMGLGVRELGKTLGREMDEP